MDEVSAGYFYSFVIVIVTLIIFSWSLFRVKGVFEGWRLTRRFSLWLRTKRRTSKKCQDLKNDDMRQYIDFYLSKRKPNYALYLRGDWGSGKTYFIKEYANETTIFGFTLFSKKACYVSLFGVKDKREFEHRLWRGLLFPNEGYWRVIVGIILLVLNILGLWFYFEKIYNFFFDGNAPIARNLYEFLVNVPIRIIDFIKESWFFKRDLGLVTIVGAFLIIFWNFRHFNVMKLFIKNHYLLLDDFERTEASCEEVLSWINEYLNVLYIPVIVLGNETEAKEKISRCHLEAMAEKKTDRTLDNPFSEYYKRAREKVIGVDCYIKQDEQKVCQIFLDNLNEDSLLRRICLQDTKNQGGFLRRVWRGLCRICSRDTGNESPFIHAFVNEILVPIKKDEKIKEGMTYTNYRAIERCFDEFEFYFGTLANEKCAKDYFERKDTKKEIENFVLCFFGLTYLKHKAEPIPSQKVIQKYCSIKAKLSPVFSRETWIELLEDRLTKKTIDSVFAILDGWKNPNGSGGLFIFNLSKTVQMEMVHIEGNQQFEMGSPDGEKGRRRDEKTHCVKLKQEYWIGKYPVTQEQWTVLMGDNPSYFRGEHLPVESITVNFQ